MPDDDPAAAALNNATKYARAEEGDHRLDVL
jgi:hypothetical protein